MSDSPLLKNARRKLAQQRQIEQDRLEANLASQRKGALRNIIRGILLLVFAVGMLLYFAH